MTDVPARRAVVVTASDRAAAGEYADRSGPLLVAGLRELGLAVDDAVVVPDGAPVERAQVLPNAELLVTSKHGTTLVPATFPKRDSQDNRMHVCMRKGEGGMTPICIFLPPST